MKKKAGRITSFTSTGSAAGKNAVRTEKTSDGREKWFVPSKGKTIVTTATSVAAMDEAVEIYEDALKRLAKR